MPDAAIVCGGPGAEIEAMSDERLRRVRGVLESMGLDALLVLGLTNIRYLSGFTGSDGALVASLDAQWFLCDSRYTTQASTETSNCTVVEYKVKVDGIACLAKEQRWKRIGFDAGQVTVSLHRAISGLLSEVELVPLGAELDELRAVKSAAEIRAIGESCSLASVALLQLLDMVRPGVTERTLAVELEILMKRSGADDKAFDFIVASGERGALPHGRATDRKLTAGELVTIDFGARLDGYHSDETVTLAVVSADCRQREIYGVVKEAHDRAMAAVKAGAGCREIDAIARDFITEQGYGAFFGHGLGHGVGLDIHEKPTLSPRSEQRLSAGMIVTIEPGIYIPGWGGVRIEDTVEVTANGCRSLTMVDKGLMVTG